jgi:diketogulonate reductase-like aldo/keto reductase
MWIGCKGGSDNWTPSSAEVHTSTHPTLHDAYLLPYLTVHRVHGLQLIEWQSLAQIIQHQMTVSTTRTTPWWSRGPIIWYKVRETIWMQCLKPQSRTAKHRTWYNEELSLYAGIMPVALPGKLKTWHKTDHGKVRKVGVSNVNCTKLSNLLALELDI